MTRLDLILVQGLPPLLIHDSCSVAGIYHPKDCLVAEIFQLTPCCSGIAAGLGPSSTTGWGCSFGHILGPARKGSSFSRNITAGDTCKIIRELAKRSMTY